MHFTVAQRDTISKRFPGHNLDAFDVIDIVCAVLDAEQQRATVAAQPLEPTGSESLAFVLNYFDAAPLNELLLAVSRLSVVLPERVRNPATYGG